MTIVDHPTGFLDADSYSRGQLCQCWGQLHDLFGVDPPGLPSDRVSNSVATYLDQS